MIDRIQRAGRQVRLVCMALLAMNTAGCGLISRAEVPVDRTQDPRILREVEALLAAEPELDASTIRVEVDGAMVLLHGSVRGIGGWKCALRVAALVEGVSSVVDYLVLERGPRDIRCVAGG